MVIQIKPIINNKRLGAQIRAWGSGKDHGRLAMGGRDNGRCAGWGRGHGSLAADPEEGACPLSPWERGYIHHHTPPVPCPSSGPRVPEGFGEEVMVTGPGVEGMDTSCRCHSQCPATVCFSAPPPFPPRHHHSRRAAPGEGRGQEGDKPCVQG